MKERKEEQSVKQWWRFRLDLKKMKKKMEKIEEWVRWSRGVGVSRAGRAVWSLVKAFCDCSSELAPPDRQLVPITPQF